MSKTILFFGTDHFSAAALRALITAGYTIAAVVTKPDSRSGRGQRVHSPVVKEIADAHGISVWQPAHIRDIHDDIVALINASSDEIVGVLSSYGRIIPQSIIDLFISGIINIHPSLLPRYRGPSPIETAIYNGDDETGVSLMRLSAEMDAGPIYAQQVHALDGHETAPELYQTLADLGGRMLVETLPSILDGSLPAYAQTGDPVYCQLLSKADSLLDPSTHTARQLERHVRAYLAFPKSKLALEDQLITLTKVHVDNGETADRPSPALLCQDGQLLVVDELISSNGRRMSGQDFLRGNLWRLRS